MVCWISQSGTYKVVLLDLKPVGWKETSRKWAVAQEIKSGDDHTCHGNRREIAQRRFVDRAQDQCDERTLCAQGPRWNLSIDPNSQVITSLGALRFASCKLSHEVR